MSEYRMKCLLDDLEREKKRAQRAERLLWEVDAVARYLGNEYGAPDCIDNHGAVYQSEQLHQLLDQVDARERQVAAPPPESEHIGPYPDHHAEEMARMKRDGELDEIGRGEGAPQTPEQTHRWTERDASGASTCADCGVDLDDDESAEVCPAPHTPQQAHGDALAALTSIRKEFVDTVADRRVREYGQKLVHDARQALTASGVPEEVRRLPDRMDRQADARDDGDFISDHARGIADASRYWAKALREALASAPAVPDGWVLVPRKPTKDMCHAGCEVSVSPDVPAEIWNAMIAAAPSDGGG